MCLQCTYFNLLRKHEVFKIKFKATVKDTYTQFLYNYLVTVYIKGFFYYTPYNTIIMTSQNQFKNNRYHYRTATPSKRLINLKKTSVA